MASPVLNPGLVAPETLVELYKLKRVTDCGPYTLLRVINCVIGAICPSPVLTYKPSNDPTVALSSGSVCKNTRYCLPNLEKSAAYIPPIYPCKVEKIELIGTPKLLATGT